MKKKGTSTSSVQAFAIILVLAILVLLALLAITYIKLALIDRNIVRNYMDNKRAKLIAQSGVDYAIARLQEDFFDTSWQQAKSVKINGVNTNYTESAGSTYGENRDIFRVHVRDCNSLINVNDGLNNERVKGNLKRILDELGKIVSIDQSKLKDPTKGLGGNIVDNRSSSGYSGKDELLKIVNGNWKEFEKFKDYVTTHAWQDPNVVNPVPLSTAVLEKYTEFNDGYANYDSTIGAYRYGRGKSSGGVTISGSLMFAPDYVTTIVSPPAGWDAAKGEYPKYAIYALDELNPQWIELTARSPVNINLADERVIKASLKDLKGIFVSERRSAYPYYVAPYAVRSGDDFFDELGFLYSTQPIDYDTALNQGLAKDIADHIRGCRNKEVVTTGPVTIDYTDAGSIWFRGAFKTWRQFNAFVDNLVQSGLIQDSREFSEYNLQKYVDSNSVIQSHRFKDLVLVSPSSPVKKIANQAKADVLKANFNPNLHLNETNPDANIATLVDKTDLIVNSTEFCFTPMGYFEIESTGYILKDKGTDNIIIAEQKIDTVVQIFDCYRETNQRQFLNHINNLTDYNNFIGQDSAPVRTNNSRTIQIGPEPEHIFDGSAPIAKGNEWGGYISLPTLKGPAGDTAVTLYSNFANNFQADYHADGQNANITIYNSADPTESKLGGIAEPAGNGPYVYSSRNRLARSFRQGDTINPKYYAVCDLRIDGAYIERHASVVYNISSNVIKDPGFWSYWVKPWFHPESTGKPRTFVTLSSVPGPDPSNDVYYFANWSFATHGVPEAEEQTLYSYGGFGSAGWTEYYYYKPMTIVCAFSTSSPEELCGYKTGSGRGKSTPVLNHIHHSDSDPNYGKYYIKSGQWTHVVCYWYLTNPYVLLLIINGKELPGTFSLTAHTTDEQPIPIDNFINASKGIRLGELSQGITTSGWVPYYTDIKRNWTADTTLDEFYIFSSIDPTNAAGMYFSGRYFKPSSSQSYFISQVLQFKKGSDISSYSTIIDPNGFIPSSADYLGQKIKIIGLSWTWYAEEAGQNITITKTVKGKVKTTTINYYGKPILKNYKDYENTQSTDPATLGSTYILPEVKIKLRLNGTELLEYTDDGYSTVNLELEDSDSIRYKVIIDIPGADQNTVLLYSPVFDDITIYYSSGVKFLSYRSVE